MKQEKEKKGLPFFGIPKLAPYLKPYKMLFFWMVVTGTVGSGMDAIIPLFQQHAIDHFIADKTMQGVGGWLALYILVMIIQTATNYISAYGACKAELYIGRDLKRETFNHLQTLSFSYFNQNSVGYTHARVMSDTDRIASTLAWGLMEGVWYIAYLLLAIVMMFALNWKLALCVMVIVPVLVLSGAYFQKKLVFFHRRVREQNSKITGAFNEGITGAKTTKTLVIEDKVEQEFDDLTGEMKRLSVRAMHFRGVFMSTTAFAASIALAIVLWRGGVITRDGVILIGTLSVFMNYAQGMMEPIQWLVQVMSSLVNVQVNVERVTRLLETESDVSDTPEVTEKYGDAFRPKKENWEPLYGDIEFQDVTFRYPDGSENVLEHFNLKVPQGTNVAIVGETGAGKSTLVNLVCRFFEPTQGRILIDGRDARERSQLWLHSNIGYVLQTPHLFSGSIRDNIRYGKKDASDEEVRAAAKTVHADEFIEQLENGYDTEVGEGGARLSTGQKQLISFARVILADPRIFVLDEATSSIDTETEVLIQSAIRTVLKNRTSFIVAHRLSTIRSADRILVIRNGRITESGTHRELLKLKGYYYDLYTTQFTETSTASLLK
jgi:ATP-binding cassette subfamily B protein